MPIHNVSYLYILQYYCLIIDFTHYSRAFDTSFKLGYTGAIGARCISHKLY